jgi:hypothetical protein
MAGAKLVQLSLDATFMEAGMSGSISGIQQIDSGSGATGASSASAAVLAVWPESAACQALFQDGGGLDMPLESTALGASGADTLASVAAPEPTAVTWLDGSASKVTVTVESTGAGCFRVSDLPGELGGGAGVTYPVTIGVKTEDGRLDGEYTGKVVVTRGGEQRRVVAEAYLDLSVDELSDSGFTDVTVPDGSDALRLRFESQSVDGEGLGKVELFAVAKPPCLTNPQPPMATPGGGMSSPGCAGEMLTKLEVASWSN